MHRSEACFIAAGYGGTLAVLANINPHLFTLRSGTLATLNSVGGAGVTALSHVS